MRTPFFQPPLRERRRLPLSRGRDAVEVGSLKAAAARGVAVRFCGAVVSEGSAESCGSFSSSSAEAGALPVRAGAGFGGIAKVSGTDSGAPFLFLSRFVAGGSVGSRLPPARFRRDVMTPRGSATWRKVTGQTSRIFVLN